MASKPKLTEEQKRQRRHARRAAKENAKVREQIPLFADLVPQSTPEIEHWRWRRNISEGVERISVMQWTNRFDEWFTIHILEFVARGLIGNDVVFFKLREKCHRTYPSSSYFYQFWKKVLCGERVEFSYHKVENRQPGQPCVVCDEWYQHPHMTPEEFYQRFPYKDEAPPGHDGRELWGKLQGILRVTE